MDWGLGLLLSGVEETDKFEFLVLFFSESIRQSPIYRCKYRQSAEKKKGTGRIPIALFHNLKFIDTGYEGKSGFFKMNLSGGVYEAHGEDFPFKSFCLPVHSAVCLHGMEAEKPGAEEVQYRVEG